MLYSHCNCFFSDHRFALLQNAGARLDDNECARDEGISSAEIRTARMEISSWPGYQLTPLHRLSGLANRCGISDLFYKDESSRFGLGSFKALGGSYAVLRLLQASVASALGVVPTSDDLMQGKYRSITKKCTVTSATDGNHGRSVAWGARLFGCQSLIYVPHSCSDHRRKAIASYGATVERTSCGYDDTVRLCSRNAQLNGFTVVSDTSWAGYEEIPATIMQGYTVMSGEVIDQLDLEKVPTHVFVQAGVGGLAAAICSHFRLRWGPNRPQIIIVEPEGAACLYSSMLAGTLTQAAAPVSTVMAGLDCGEPSLLAWEVLRRNADFSVTIPDGVVADCIRLLAVSPYGDQPIVAGESAVAGLAALLFVSENAEARDQLRLNAQSRVVVFGTEGDTDPCIYEKMTGYPAQEVRDSAGAWRSKRN